VLRSLAFSSAKLSILPIPRLRSTASVVSWSRRGGRCSYLESFHLIFSLDLSRASILSLIRVKQSITQARAKLAAALPSTTQILRGSWLHRRIRHRSGCATCARGPGHLVRVLAVSYPGGRTKQISLSAEQKPRFHCEIRLNTCRTASGGCSIDFGVTRRCQTARQ
jgi:hypothetical protein